MTNVGRHRGGAWLAPVLCLAGCYAHHFTGAEEDAGSTPRWDADTPDDPPDASSGDAGTDAARPRDAGVDAHRPRDAGTDAARDAGIDAPLDAGTDAGPCPAGTSPTSGGCRALTPTSPCEVPGNVLHLDGDSWVHTGVRTLDATNARFSVNAYAAPRWMDLPEPNTIDAQVEIEPPDGRPDSYDLEISAGGLERPLEVGVYEGATRFPFSVSDATPGLALHSTGRGCNRVSGRFEVHRINLEGETVREVLVSFDHYCETRSLVRGCLHYVAP